MAHWLANSAPEVESFREAAIILMELSQLSSNRMMIENLEKQGVSLTAKRNHALVPNVKAIKGAGRPAYSLRQLYHCMSLILGPCHDGG